MDSKKWILIHLVSLISCLFIINVDAGSYHPSSEGKFGALSGEGAYEALTKRFDAEVLEAESDASDAGDGKSFLITKFGAIADGKTDSADAFMKAWKQACDTDGGILDVPQGSFFLSGAQFQGPCTGKTSFRTMGTIVASSDVPKDQVSWIQYLKVNDLEILGGGTFDGNGASAWANKRKSCKVNSDCALPDSLRFDSMVNLHISGIKSINSKMFHINVQNGQNVVIESINIVAPADSPNTDGIHLGKSNSVNITNSNIGTGDDCISISDGNTNITISLVNCGPGHGISIGSLGRSEGEKGVSGISVSDSIITKTTNGLRIKTWPYSVVKTLVSDITYKNITLDDAQNPIFIDQHYCSKNYCTSKGESTVKIQNVKFIDVHGTSADPIGVVLNCSSTVPCQDIEFTNLKLVVYGTSKPAGTICANADARFSGYQLIESSCKNSGSLGLNF